jgi:3-oxoadipate enol-lactonase
VLVLSNSLGTNRNMWAPQMEAFTGEFRVLRYDGRGHGASTAPPGGYSLDRLGTDVLELIDALAVAKVHFCGLSLGGMVGQWLGYRAPERLDKLVLANTSGYMGPPSVWQKRIDLVRREGLEAIADSTVERWLTARFRAENPGRVADLRAMLLATSPQGYVGCCAAIRDMDLRRIAPLVETSTLVIGGTADPATPPAHSRALSLAIPNANVPVMFEAAHLSNYEASESFTGCVLKFLKEGTTGNASAGSNCRSASAG